MNQNFTSTTTPKFNFFKKTLLTALLGMSLVASAQNLDKANHPLESIKGMEDVSKRDLFSRHFIGDNGTTAVIGAGAINYKKDGAFYAINNAIISNSDASYPFANTENLMETHFGSTSHIGIRSKTSEGTLTEFINSKMYWESNLQVINSVEASDVPVSIIKNKATYNQIFAGVDAEIVILNGKRKLNYILSSPTFLNDAPTNADYLVFAEDIVLPTSWTHRITSAGIYLIDSRNNEIYLYENPYSLDSGNKSLRNNNTIMTASKTGNVLSIFTKVKTEWLLNSARVFPIMVDPTATVYPNTTTFQTGSVYSSDGYKVDDMIVFGRDEDIGSTPDFLRGWARFNTASIPDDSYIDSGTTIHFYINDGSPDYSPTNGHSLVISQIPATINPATANGGILFSVIEQNGYSPVMTSAINTIGWKSHTLTSAQIAIDIKNQLVQNTFSVGFMPQGDFYPEEYLIVTGWDEPQKPYLVINYSAPMNVADHSKVIGIYPNPVSSELSINSDFDVASVQVYSMLGQMVASNKAQNSISVSQLSAGIYTIKITLKDGVSTTQKFVKK